MYTLEWVNFYLSHCRLFGTSLEIIDFPTIDTVRKKKVHLAGNADSEVSQENLLS